MYCKILDECKKKALDKLLFTSVLEVFCMTRNLLVSGFSYNACQKSWNTSANFALFCDFPLSSLQQCCFVVKKSG